MAPLNDNDLRKLKLEKSKAKLGVDGVENEVCSICCDDMLPKTLVRRMPECKHMFH